MIKYLRQQVVDDLFLQVPENLDRYRNGDFDYLLNDPSFYRELDVATPATVKLKGKKGARGDVKSAQRLWKAYGHLLPSDARDERIWTMASHTTFLDYSRQRFTISDDDEVAVKTIRAHMFARTNRALERDHAISRLWWFAFMANRVDGMTLGKALEVFLYKTDVRAGLVERPTMSQTTALFSAWIEVLGQNKKTKEQAYFSRKVYRPAFRQINALGGYVLLDSLSKARLKSVVEEALEAHSSD